MNEELKFIVEHVNKLFGTNYNMMSFDSMSNTSVLQVLGDVLVKLEVAEKVSKRIRRKGAVTFIYRLTLMETLILQLLTY